jgi:HipA-like kinase
MEANDLGTYVVKFRGAGHGRKALVAEVVCARLALELGLPVPELVTVEVGAALAAGEPDEEVHALLRGQCRAKPRRRLPAAAQSYSRALCTPA